MVAEGLADEVLEGEDDEEELVPDQPEANASGLEEVLTAEAEVLAAEIQALEEEGMEPDVLEALECGVEQAAESLVRSRVQSEPLFRQCVRLATRLPKSRRIEDMESL